MAGKWLRTTGRDGRQHVLYLPERARHILTSGCSCHPTIDQGVVMHTFLSSATTRQTAAH
jgi:hypothetical protein